MNITTQETEQGGMFQESENFWCDMYFFKGVLISKPIFDFLQDISNQSINYVQTTPSTDS